MPVDTSCIFRDVWLRSEIYLFKDLIVFMSFLTLLDDSEILPLSFLAILLFFAGQCLVGTDGLARKRGAAIGGLAFIAYLIYGISRDGFADPGQLILRVVRGGSDLCDTPDVRVRVEDADGTLGTKSGAENGEAQRDA